jgi:hypothetical protein
LLPLLDPDDPDEPDDPDDEREGALMLPPL